MGQDGKLLASVRVHYCGPECDEDLADAATIEEFICVGSWVRRCVPFHDQCSISTAGRQDSRTTRESVNSGPTVLATKYYSSD
jgi:hypothetical protein